MAFSEATKSSVKKRAHFACCLCHGVGIELHHIIPQAEDGPDTEDNAAPLCPSCHETYGGNPTKRKFIREARDFWYDVCASRYASDANRLDSLQQMLQLLPTKADLEQIIVRASALPTASHDSSPGNTVEDSLPQEFHNAPVNPLTLKNYLRHMYGCLSHCGDSAVAKLVEDVRSVGHASILSLHRVLSLTRGPAAEVIQERRNCGEDMDVRTDAFPARLFLAVLDEAYCAKFYPKVYEKNIQKRWTRPRRE